MADPIAKDEQAPSRPNTTSLADFIEANHRLITVLGVFTAVTAFSAAFRVQAFANTLYALFLTLTLLVWLELWARFPSSLPSWRLFWFENFLSLAMFALMAYWVVSIRSFFPPFVFLLAFMAVTSLVSYILKRFDVFNRAF